MVTNVGEKKKSKNRISGFAPGLALTYRLHRLAISLATDTASTPSTMFECVAAPERIVDRAMRQVGGGAGAMNAAAVERLNVWRGGGEAAVGGDGHRRLSHLR